MGIFRRGPRPIFPPGMSRWLDQFGRYSADPSHRGREELKEEEMLPYCYERATADPDRFLAELEALVANDEGGFATYGAARLAFEMFGGSEMLTMPAALPLLDAGIDFQLARGKAPAMLRGYEFERFSQIRHRYRPRD
jgi:hypothetical protein